MKYLSTVFLFIPSTRAEETHEKILDTKGIVTTYVQSDEMETFEHHNQKPLGIELAIRVKTGEMISAKVSRIPMKAHAASPAEKAKYAALSTRDQKQTEMLMDVEKVITGKSTLESDGKYIARKTVNKILTNTNYESKVRSCEMWRINKTCMVLRQNISRLRRKTLATTKRMDRLQKHLSLYIAYNNGYEIF